MGLFLRVALTNSLTSGMIGNRRTRKTFDPRFATRSATYKFTPEIRATTMIKVETDRTIPSSIRNERSLCARRVSRATKMGSRSWIRVFMKSRWSSSWQALSTARTRILHAEGSGKDSTAWFHSKDPKKSGVSSNCRIETQIIAVRRNHQARERHPQDHVHSMIVTGRKLVGSL